MGTDQRTLKCGYRSEMSWVQIRDVVGTDQRVGTEQGPSIDLSSTYVGPETLFLDRNGLSEWLINNQVVSQ